jgi:cell division protein FtsL
VKVVGYRPSNLWLRRELDTRWRRWLTRCVLGALVVSAVLAAFVAPRQATLQARYQIAKLSLEVSRLESEYRRLHLEREALSSPTALATQLTDLGLAPVSWERVVHLTPEGRLVLPKVTPTPANARLPAPRKGAH